MRHHEGLLPILIAALFLALALGRVGQRVARAANEARCAGFWDEGIPVHVEDARDRDYCRHFKRSRCTIAGSDDSTPLRRVFKDDERLPLLAQFYAHDDTRPRRAGTGFSAERCGERLSVRLERIAEPRDLLVEQLKDAKVERRHRGGQPHRCKRKRGRFECEPGRKKHWDWVGPSSHAGVPVVRVHMNQDARKTLRIARPEGRARLHLIYGFTDEAERLRTPLLGFTRLRVRHDQRFLYRGVAYPRFRDDEVVIDLSSVPVGDDIEISLDGLGSRFGEIWLSGRFLP